MCLSLQSARRHRDLHEKTKTCFRGTRSLSTAPFRTHSCTWSTNAAEGKAGSAGLRRAVLCILQWQRYYVKRLCARPSAHQYRQSRPCSTGGEATRVCVVQVRGTGYSYAAASTSQNFRLFLCLRQTIVPDNGLIVFRWHDWLVRAGFSVCISDWILYVVREAILFLGTVKIFRGIVGNYWSSCDV